MTLDYTTYVSQLANLMAQTSTDANFQTFLPGCIDYAEQRIYRELDMLNSVVVDNGSFQANTRNFTLPTNIGTFIVVEAISAIDSNNTRFPLTQVTRDFLDAVYPNQTLATGTPKFFSPISDTTFIVGPAPDQNYTAEVTGTQRPNPLSATNTTTLLTTYCPDLFIAASMVFATGYQRDFGAQSDDPKMGQSWEQQYQMLMASAKDEQYRAKSEGNAWQPFSTPSAVTPPRV